MRKNFHPVYNLHHDLPAGLVVFLVALPLCLGIALASGAPLISGIIAGVVGGLVVGFISNSSISVSGPAAGLTAIVITSTEKLGGFEPFLLAVALSGIFQFLLGQFKAGTLGNYFPNSVIKGMLTAIGLILILKQIPHALGYDTDYEGDEQFFQSDGRNTFTELIDTLGNINPLITGITILSVLILLFFESSLFKRYRWTTYFPAPLLVVIVGIFIQIQCSGTDSAISVNHLVNIPNLDALLNTPGSWVLPDLSKILNTDIWVIALTICIVASLESLLSIDAVDKLDPYKRVTNLNRELKAQGIGNFVSGLLGGLPVTSVIVRSSANITSGGRTRTSTIFHGTLLLSCTVFLPTLLNKIPLSSLAAILLMVGYKLARPGIFTFMYRKGHDQFIPFIVTCIAILLSDLLLGIAIGMVAGLFFVLKTNFHEAVMLVNDENRYLLRLTKDVSFINKKVLRDKLFSIPEGSYVIIDGASSHFIDHDIIDTLSDFVENAKTRDITVEIKKTNTATHHFFKKQETTTIPA